MSELHVIAARRNARREGRAAVLVPAALEATASLVRSGALQPYLDAATRAALEQAAEMAATWSRRAPALFEVQLPAPAARAALSEARARMRAVASATAAQRGAELWSWTVENGQYRLAPFGQREAHETESNAAQLWSTIDLAR